MCKSLKALIQKSCSQCISTLLFVYLNKCKHIAVRHVLYVYHTLSGIQVTITLANQVSRLQPNYWSSHLPVQISPHEFWTFFLSFIPLVPETTLNVVTDNWCGYKCCQQTDLPSNRLSQSKHASSLCHAWGNTAIAWQVLATLLPNVASLIWWPSSVSGC